MEVVSRAATQQRNCVLGLLDECSELFFVQIAYDFGQETFLKLGEVVSMCFPFGTTASVLATMQCAALQSRILSAIKTAIG